MNNKTEKPMNRNKITLKWGTLKGWHLETEDAVQLLRKYHEEPVSGSVMLQRDTKTQKETILKLIDVCGEILLDWDGKIVSRDEAKDYILNYGKSK